MKLNKKVKVYSVLYEISKNEDFSCFEPGDQIEVYPLMWFENNVCLLYSPPEKSSGSCGCFFFGERTETDDGEMFKRAFNGKHLDFFSNSDTHDNNRALLSGFELEPSESVLSAITLLKNHGYDVIRK